jgi:hypothetical protein
MNIDATSFVGHACSNCNNMGRQSHNWRCIIPFELNRSAGDVAALGVSLCGLL